MKHLNRMSRCARLVCLDAPLRSPKLVLWDAQIIHTTFDTWTVIGFESIETDSGDRHDYAQTWLMTPVP